MHFLTKLKENLGLFIIMNKLSCLEVFKLCVSIAQVYTS